MWIPALRFNCNAQPEAAASLATQFDLECVRRALQHRVGSSTQPSSQKQEHSMPFFSFTLVRKMVHDHFLNELLHRS
jgi:hypothetical protein